MVWDPDERSAAPNPCGAASRDPSTSVSKLPGGDRSSRKARATLCARRST